MSERGLNAFTQACWRFVIRSERANRSYHSVMFLKELIADGAVLQVPFDILVGDGIQLAIQIRIDQFADFLAVHATSPFQGGHSGIPSVEHGRVRVVT